MLSHLRPAVVSMGLFTLLLGLAYPLAVTGVAQVAFPAQAGGSLLRDAKGAVVGSALIGQNFAAPGYFHPRPSAAGEGYDAAASSGSNLGPTSQALADRIGEGVAAARAEGVTGPVPADLVTASGSGLDPDLSPAAAYSQVARVAAARGLPAAQVRALVGRSIDGPTLGLLGDPHVNVLELNRQLDAIGANEGR
jgi:K+-transporting ATPase ATPase C chain